MEYPAEGGGGYDHGVHVVALGAGEVPHQIAQQRLGEEGYVVVEVFLEIGVVAEHRGHAETARQAHARVMGDEGRLDVHDVGTEVLQFGVVRHDLAHAHHPVFGVEQHAPRRDAGDPVLVMGGAGVIRGDQVDLVAQPFELSAEGEDGGGDAVDAGKVDVGDKQDAHRRRDSAG